MKINKVFARHHLKGFNNVRYNILLAGITLIFIVLVAGLTGLQHCAVWKMRLTVDPLPDLHCQRGEPDRSLRRCSRHERAGT